MRSTLLHLLPAIALLIGSCAASPQESGAPPDSPAPAEPTPAVALAPAPSAPPVPKAPAAPAAPPAAPVPKASEALNREIVDILREYPFGEAHPYIWHKGLHTDGVTRSLLWRGVSLAEPLPDKGIHCSGITFEVYVRALQRAAGEGASGPSPEELLALKESWYVREEGSDGGPVDALARHGLGQSITDPEQLQPGDFVQWWRNNKKGHSAIFIQHTRNGDGSLRGMVYWSAQGTSKGIGQRRVSIGEDINQITPGRLYGVRALRPG